MVEIKDIGELYTWVDLEQNGVIRKCRIVRQCTLKNKLRRTTSPGQKVTMRREAQRKKTGVCEGFGLSPKMPWRMSSILAHLGVLE